MTSPNPRDSTRYELRTIWHETSRTTRHGTLREVQDKIAEDAASERPPLRYTIVRIVRTEVDALGNPTR
jgi:hypothetical protein